ncbi:hypothetical protein P7K49_017932 [Saguinus oedipus]|uniref:Uncharacterized protein n=1 Tax=Saguinus oedipus TaxID=9490 RepID=A0ABQ9V4N5_SAGOE|nr:hypothetical protein P7K49_017932 [Saguinus oedipus]
MRRDDLPGLQENQPKSKKVEMISQETHPSTTVRLDATAPIHATLFFQDPLNAGRVTDGPLIQSSYMSNDQRKVWCKEKRSENIKCCQHVSVQGSDSADEMGEQQPPGFLYSNTISIAAAVDFNIQVRLSDEIHSST